MNQVEKINKLLDMGQEMGATTEEWHVALLSSIAESLAVIADEITDEDLDAKVKEDMCDNYCKYPIMNMEESDLEAVCETCPLNNMYGRKKQ